MEKHLILAFAVPILSLMQAFSQEPASSSNAVPVWGRPVDGLKVGISRDTATSDLRRLPKVFFHVANDDAKEIPGIIQSGAMCIVTVNGQHFAQEFLEGKRSRMPPGRKYGPIPIDTERLRRIPELRAWRSITQTAPRPELREGTNTVSVHYLLDEKLVESGQIQVVVVSAEDFHLVQTQVRDASAPGVPIESLTVYVLVLPDHRPEVFKTFDSKPMEEAISALPRGSVLHYDGNGLMASPPEAQIEALMAYCKKKGVSFIRSPTN